MLWVLNRAAYIDSDDINFEIFSYLSELEFLFG